MNRHSQCSYFRLSLALVIFTCVTSGSKAQTEKITYPEQFLFQDFTKGKVLLKRGSGYDMILNYNIVFEKVVIIQENKICDLSNPGSVDTIYIFNRKFIPAGQVFYELLSKRPFVLFVQHKSKISLPPKMDSYGKIPETGAADAKKILIIGNKSNISSDQELIFTREDVYWVQLDNSMLGFKDAMEFYKIFPDIKSEAKQYIRQNKIKFENPDDIEKLMIYCNGLLKSGINKS
ncbi:MAG TPA: hypothetical protein VFE71_04945 [Bacteroidales bacterium]|nr:hypothetical protein [Bacteroidales bacterium]